MNKIVLLIVCGILFKLSSTLAIGLNEPSFTSQSVSVTSDNISLFGTLVLPKGIENPPVVLIISGSGPTDRDGNPPGMPNNSLKYLAEELAMKGIASVRYDKRMIGESKSTQKEGDLLFEDYINDAVSWLNKLKGDNNYSSVFVAGHSEGSLIGMVAANRAKINGFISIAGPGRRIDKAILEQMSLYPEAMVNATRIILDSLVAGKLFPDAPQMLYGLFRPSIQPYMINWLKYDPAKEVGLLDYPVLIIQGTTDIQVTIKDAELLAQGNNMSKLVIIEGMNHILKNAEADRLKNMETYSNPSLPLVAELVNSIEDYIKGRSIL